MRPEAMNEPIARTIIQFRDSILEKGGDAKDISITLPDQVFDMLIAEVGPYLTRWTRTGTRDDPYIEIFGTKVWRSGAYRMKDEQEKR